MELLTDMVTNPVTWIIIVGGFAMLYVAMR